MRRPAAGPVTSPAASAKHSIRAMARRWKGLHDEVQEHDALLGELTKAHAPDLVDAFGIGADRMTATGGPPPGCVSGSASSARARS